MSNLCIYFLWLMISAPHTERPMTALGFETEEACKTAAEAVNRRTNHPVVCVRVK